MSFLNFYLIMSVFYLTYYFIFFLSFRFVQLSWGRGECCLKERGDWIELEIYCSLKTSRYAKRVLALGRWFSNHIHRIFQL